MVAFAHRHKTRSKCCIAQLNATIIVLIGARAALKTGAVVRGERRVEVAAALRRAAALLRFAFALCKRNNQPKRLKTAQTS